MTPGLRDGSAVEALDRESLRAARTHVGDECCERRPEPLGIGVAQRHERAAAALDEESRIPVEQHDPRTGDTGGTSTGAARPRQGSSIGLRRIGRGEHERLGLVAAPRRPELTKPLDRTWQRELRTAETFDEVPAPADAERLERLQLRVHGAVSTANPLATNTVAGHDALALEQELGERSPIRRPREQRGRERPAPLRRRRGRPPRACEAPPGAVGPRQLVPARGAQRRPRVVGHLSGPDELPEPCQHVLGRERGRADEVCPEQRTLGERGTNRDGDIAFRSGFGRGRAEKRRIVAEVQGDAIEAGADPDDLARGAEHVQIGRPERGHAPREDVALPERRGKRHALQRDERLAEALPAPDPVPGGQEAPEVDLLRGLDLAPEHGERRAPDAAQDVWIAPLALGATRAKLTAHELVVDLERCELRLDARGVEAEARDELGRRERAVRLRVPPEHRSQRTLDRLEEDLRHAARRHGAERVAHEPGVLDGDEQLRIAEPHADRAPLAQERLREPAVVLPVEQRASAAEEVVQLVDVPRHELAATPRPARSRRGRGARAAPRCP